MSPIKYQKNNMKVISEKVKVRSHNTLIYVILFNYLKKILKIAD
jgi:hypothetical protein